MSTEYIAVIATLIAHLFPTVGSDAVTTTIKTLITVGSGVYLLYKRYKRGGINVAGIRQ